MGQPKPQKHTHRQLKNRKIEQGGCLEWIGRSIQYQLPWVRDESEKQGTTQNTKQARTDQFARGATKRPLTSSSGDSPVGPVVLIAGLVFDDPRFAFLRAPLTVALG